MPWRSSPTSVADVGATTAGEDAHPPAISPTASTPTLTDNPFIFLLVLPAWSAGYFDTSTRLIPRSAAVPAPRIQSARCPSASCFRGAGFTIPPAGAPIKSYRPRDPVRSPGEKSSTSRHADPPTHVPPPWARIVRLRRRKPVPVRVVRALDSHHRHCRDQPARAGSATSPHHQRFAC